MKFPGQGRAACAVLAAVAVLAAACGPTPSVAPPGPSPAASAKAARAEGEAKRGCYDGFKTAIEIYESLAADPVMARRVAFSQVRTLLLMIVRERELGILNNAYYEKGLAVIRADPALQQFLALFEVAHSMTIQTRGVLRDFMAGFSPRSMDDAKKEAAFQAGLKAKTAAEDFYAYLYAAFYIGGGGYGVDRADLDTLVKAYPDSVLMRYRDAVFPPGSEEKIQALIAADPRFFEGYYYLGDISLKKGKLLEAEKRFLRAAEGLAVSPQVNILLASIYFATEEFDKSLDYYDRTLAISPEYRDALLGKALCLSYQQKHTEAIAELDRLIKLGFYLLGEGYYWLAWNEHELKDNDAAQLHIEESKGRLPTNSEVFGLAGTIALEKGESGRAEREFLEALKYNAANIEALFGLGRIAAGQGKWEESAGHLEKAAAVAGQAETAVAAKIEEIKAAEMAADRKARLLSKKEQQLRINRATRATACLEAAIGHLNAGNMARAAAYAARAAEHPQFKSQADDLLKKIK
jgi:tetratricopeptide (TPR) repeat protein